MCKLIIVCLSVVVAWAVRAEAQCGIGFATTHGGETTALAYVDTNTVIVARGLTLELLRSTGVDATPAVLATIHLEAPVKEISMSFGSGRAFVLMENGTITVVYVTLVGQVVTFQRGETVGSALDFFIDIVAADGRVHAVERSTFFSGPMLVTESTLKFYDFDTPTPTLLSTMPALAEDYRFDRAVRIGNRLWAGFNSLNSNVYGIDGIDYTVPTAPVRAGSSLNFINLNNGNTQVTAMAAIGLHVFLSYRDSNEDWLRAADTTNPASIVWRPPVDLNSIAERIAVVGNQLHVAVGAAGISVWNAANPGALSWLGTTAIAGGEIHDVAGIAGTDYVAAGYAGFRTLNSTVPAAMTTRSAIVTPPEEPLAVRQLGSQTLTLDQNGQLLRISNFTLTGAAQTIGTLPIVRATMLELSIQPGGQFAVAGGGSVGSVQVIDLANPATPQVRSVTAITPNFVRAMSCTGTRLYVADTENILYIVDLSNPSSPQVRRALPLATTPAIVSITSWPNAAALAWGTRGVTIFDTTSATSPILTATWNPVTGYDARGLVKGPSALYVGSRVPVPSLSVPRLEAINVTNLSSPFLMWAREDAGLDWLRDIESLTHVVNGTDQFLVTTGRYIDGQSTVRVFDVTNPAGGPEIARREVWNAYSPAAAASGGSRLLLAANGGGVVELTTPTQWAPSFASYAVSQEACIGQTVAFTIAEPVVSARPSAALRWRRGNVPLTDGPTPWGTVISGSSTPTLTLIGARRVDTGSYILSAENTCGIAYSGFGALTFPCIADFNCSGSVTIQDIFDFLSAFFTDNTLADVNASGGVSVQDVFDFLTAWFAGCP